MNQETGSAEPLARTTSAGGDSTRPPAKERVLAAAYDLFCQHGIRAVGIDTIIERSGVAKMTLYRHFASKDDLVLAVLARREQLWSQGWLPDEVMSRAETGAQRMLAVFDVFDGWFQRPSFEGCFFINALLEVEDPDEGIHAASREQLARIRSFVEELARSAGIADPQSVAHQWHILMKGSIVAAQEGDRQAAKRAQAMGRLLLDSLLPAP
jgi:AcrR family transcriptional regulator